MNFKQKVCITRNGIILGIFDKILDSDGDNFIRVLNDGKYGAINADGRVLFDCLFDTMSLPVDHLVVATRTKEVTKYAILTTEGGVMYRSLNSAKFMGYGFVKFEKNGKWGIVSEKKKVVADVMYDSIGYFINGFAPLRRNEVTTYIDTYGNHFFCTEEQLKNIQKQ